jgi:DNA (cytosine-5)-methyltransferase 1
MNRAPRVLDFFCGIGGLTLGLHKAGLESIGGIDNWPDAVRTFEHNHRSLRCLTADITALSVARIEQTFGVNRSDVDVVVGGPPCQGFSTVGKRDSSDPRNLLWEHYFELVNEIRPAYVLIENVEGLVVMDKGSVCERIVSSFGEIGYRMKWRLFRSADYGVPQLRKRVIFFGWLHGLATPVFPRPNGTPPVTVADAIYDLPPLSPGEMKTEYQSPPTTDYQRARRGRTEVVRNHEAANHTPHLVEMLSHIPDGGNRKSIPDHLQPKSGFHNSYSRLASDKPAVAVTSNMRKPSSARATHPKQHRGLTVREGLRLQSFDDSFEVLGSRTSQYLQVGNAVPPLLGEAVGRELLKAFSANTQKAVDAARRREPEPVQVSVRRPIALSVLRPIIHKCIVRRIKRCDGRQHPLGSLGVLFDMRQIVQSSRIRLALR